MLSTLAGDVDDRSLGIAGELPIYCEKDETFLNYVLVAQRGLPEGRLATPQSRLQVREIRSI